MTSVDLNQRLESVPPLLVEKPKPPKPQPPNPPDQLPPEPQVPEPLPPDLFPVPKLPDERPKMISERIYVKS
jgi:hypothetical protein